MGKPRYIAAEFGLSVGFGKKSFRVVGVESTVLNSHDLIFAANNDAIAFVLLYHLGLYFSSSFIWLPTHSIEKFLKAYLLAHKNYDKNSLKKIGHDLKKLWSQYKSEYGFDVFPNIEEYIDEISAITPDVRYGDKSIGLNDNLLSGFVFLLVHFNKFKRGSTNYGSSYYGFWDEEIPSMHGLSESYLKGIFKSYLHLIIEHQVTLSPSGICHPHKYEEVAFLKQNRTHSDCPFCSKKAGLDVSKPGLTTPETCVLVREYINKNTMPT